MMFETRCAGCDKAGAAICTTCRFALISRTPRPQAHGVLAAVPFTGRARDVLLSLKYRNRRQVARHLGSLVVNCLVEQGVYDDVDVVTWAPTSSKRRQQRGFDQGEVIARTVARQLGLPARRLVERTGRCAPQTGQTRSSRLVGPSFRARPGLDGLRVLVVDDVVTTGATLRAAEQALRHEGALGVIKAAVASTPATTQASAGAKVLAFKVPARATAA
jgi:ComF family protein